MQTELTTLDSDLKAINKALEDILSTKEDQHSSLYEAARYTVLGPGKRIRPLLCLAIAQMLGVDSNQAILPAAALELIHSYSLIHDDLPAMDNDDYRRGRLTLHKVYPEGHAILTGDYLLTYAFEILSHASFIATEKQVKLIRILAKAAGGEGMVGGQVRDIDAKNKSLTLSNLKELHLRKTGKMIQASILFGAILGDADEVHYSLLEQIGEKIGLAFQINDDIIDVINSAQKHGYATPSDQINQKTTYVTLLGLEEAQHMVKQLLAEIQILLENLPFEKEKLKLILDKAFSIK